MRVLLGLAVLVVVLATVAQLVKSQLGSLSVVGGLPSTAPSSRAAPAASAPPAPGLRQSPVADDIRRAMDAGAASRASEPER